MFDLYLECLFFMNLANINRDFDQAIFDYLLLVFF